MKDLAMSNIQCGSDFEPYVDNGGNVAAIAGDDFVVIGGDTRLSMGYSIMSRDSSKICRMTSKSFLASGGCHTDIFTLQKNLNARIHMYKLNHNKEMTVDSLAQLLSVTLFQRRMFPYYAFNILAGLDSEGKGAIYSYDAVGSYERIPHGAQGSASSSMTAALDNLVDHKNRHDPRLPITVDDAVKIMKDLFVSVTEVDIHSGDNLEILILTRDGIKTETFPLRKD